MSVSKLFFSKTSVIKPTKYILNDGTVWVGTDPDNSTQTVYSTGLSTQLCGE